MISRPDLASRQRTGRIVRVSIACSLLVHLLFFALAFGVYDALGRFVPHRQQPKHDDETVTLSTALHFERRPRAAASHPGGGAVRPPAPVAQRPSAHVAAVARPATQAHAAPRPSELRPRELAKTAPRATPQPVARQRQLALVQHRPAPSAQEHATAATLSAARLAQIQRDLAASIAKDRARENPLSNVARRVTAAATTRRYAINVAGTRSALRGAEGLCAPQQTWTAGGYIYFYVSCRTQRADGSVRNEVIPWPLRFRPSQVAYGPGGTAAPPPGEIPLPLPGWRLPPSQYVDPDVLDFLRERGVATLVGADRR